MAKKIESIKKGDFITKGYLDKALDKALKEQSKTIIETVSFGFEKNRKEHEIFESKIDFIFKEFKENRKEHKIFEDKIDKLASIACYSVA